MTSKSHKKSQSKSGKNDASNVVGVKTKGKSFLRKCVKGTENPSNINAYIEAWHVDKTIRVRIHTFLGMTFEEYAAWVENPAALKGIIAKHKK